jgi:hypothetical protein
MYVCMLTLLLNPDRNFGIYSLGKIKARPWLALAVLVMLPGGRHLVEPRVDGICKATSGAAKVPWHAINAGAMCTMDTDKYKTRMHLAESRYFRLLESCFDDSHQ